MTFYPKSFSHFIRDFLLIDEKIFREEYRDKKFKYNLSTNFLNKFKKLTKKNIQDLLFSNIVEDRDLRIVKDGDRLNTSELPKKQRIRTYSLLEKFHNNYSIILYNAHKYCEDLAIFAHYLSCHIFGEVYINLYLSPPGSTALSPHFDTHEVFAIQLYGNKRWFLYDQYNKPLINSFQPNLKNIEWKELIEMFEGSTLFIPRGLVHSAVTLENLSIHMTISIYPPQKIDLCKSSLLINSNLNEELRDLYDFDNQPNFEIKLPRPGEEEFKKILFYLPTPVSQGLSNNENLVSPTSSLSIFEKAITKNSQEFIDIKLTLTHESIYFLEFDDYYMVFDYKSKVSLPKSLRNSDSKSYDELIKFLKKQDSSNSLNLSIKSKKILLKFIRKMILARILEESN